jgi:hypothetical protein
MSSSFRNDFDVSKDELPESLTASKSSKAAKATAVAEGEFSAFKAIMMGHDVDVKAAEHLAARLQREVDNSVACQKCHACCACFPEADVPRMKRHKAMAKIKGFDCECLGKEALMAVAIGKKGAVLFALQGLSVGLEVRVCESRAVVHAWQSVAYLSWLLFVQVWHYLGADKSEGVSSISPGEFKLHDGSSSEDNDSSSEDDDSTTWQHAGIPDVTLDDQAKHPLSKPPRRGKFFRGRITRFDNRAQAHYIVFADGQEGWYQLWRSDEHFEML